MTPQPLIKRIDVMRLRLRLMAMPTPIFTIRLSPKTQGDLRQMAALYGSPNARAFAREVLETMCSGDLERIKEFSRRLMVGMGEQLALKLTAAVDEANATRATRATRVTRTARKPRKPRRRGRRGD